MKKVKFVLIVIILQFTLGSYSQDIKRYESDYSIKMTIDKDDESRDGGKLEDIARIPVSIIFDMANSTVEVKLSEENKRLYFFTSVKYNQTFTSKGKEYVAYTAYKDGNPYFISFSDDLIKIDNRLKYKTLAFHLKK